MNQYLPFIQVAIITGIMVCLIMAQIYQRKQRRVVGDLLREHAKLRSECEKLRLYSRLLREAVAGVRRPDAPVPPATTEYVKEVQNGS